MRSPASRLRGARTHACRVGTLADALCPGAQKRRDDSRRGTQEGVRHGAIRLPTRTLILLLAASATPFAQTAPPADQNSASVEGVVVNAVTGDPVARAHVALFSFAEGRQQRYGAMTTAEGKFSVTGLPVGNYNVSVNRLGFIFNPRGPNGFTLKPGDHKNDVTLKLTPTGAIAGTVVDADGEPVENCNVFAESSRGGQVSQSDAQGRFRIGGLAPGKYRVKATPEDPQTPPEIRTDGTAEAHYSETYYPSVLDAAGGGTINVAAGGESGGTEIRLVRTPIVRVSGKVTGIPPGADNVFLMVQRQHDDNRRLFGGFSRNSGWNGSAQVKKDGTFTMWRLAPGPYRIAAQWNNAGAQMVASAPVEVVVGESDIDGIELHMMAAADVTGLVEYESDDAKPPAPAAQTQPMRRRGPQLMLQGIDGTNGNANGQVDSSGAFTLEKVVPGRYSVMWTGGSGYVKSIRLGATEMTDGILDLSGGAAGAALTVVVSAQFGSVSGTVQTDGAPTEGLRVLLLRDSQGPGGGMPLQLSGLRAGGSYSFNSVVPGTYKLAVITEEDINPVLVGGEEWEQYAPVTETVTIAAGDKASQDLKVLKRP